MPKRIVVVGDVNIDVVVAADQIPRIGENCLWLEAQSS